MKLHHLSPILWTKDLAATITFYETILGFIARNNFPNFVALKRDEAEIMFIIPQNGEDCGEEEQPEFFPRPLLTGNIFIFMDEVDALWQEVKEKATIKTPIANREYMMRDFSILDNNGYELVFGQDIS